MDRVLKTELLGFGIGFAGLLLFALVVEEVERFREVEELTAFDVAVAQWLGAHVPAPVFAAGLVLAHIGSVVVVGPLVLAAAIFSWSRGRRPEAVTISAGALFLLLVVTMLKWYFGRPRPDVGLATETGLSFPSGHSAFGAYLAVVLVWFALRYVRPRSRAVALLSLAAAWAFLQAAGRVVIGVHYVSDVLAGVGVGLAVGGFGLAAAPLGARLARRWRRHRPSSRST